MGHLPHEMFKLGRTILGPMAAFAQLTVLALHLKCHNKTFLISAIM